MQYIKTAHEAELNAERVMVSWGYIDAKATTGGSDGGIDVRSSRALAQVKWRGAQVSRDEIQKLYGARGADRTRDLFFFAASGYSKPAIAAASELGVRLFTYDPSGAVQLVNGSVVAQRVDATPEQRTGDMVSSRRIRTNCRPVSYRDIVAFY